LKPTIETILSTIPAWQSASISHEPLGGGFTNDTYKVAVDDATYVVRINGTQNHFLGLSRALEIQAIERAYAMGVTPRVFKLGSPDEVLITEYLPDGQVKPEESHSPQFIIQLATLLKKIHSIEGIARHNNPFEMIERYITSAESLGVSKPEGFATHLTRMNEIAQQRSGAVEKYCHNDIFTFNLLWDEGQLRAIDWELSGYGDVFFELSVMAYSNNYTTAEERQLLTAYFGEYDDEMQCILKDMRYVSLIREVAWAMLMTAIVQDPLNHSMDYVGFQKQVIERLDGGY
jgi:thiamine kinase-like enzyme